MSPVIVSALFLSALSAPAQGDPNVSKASLAYHEHRLRITQPSYSLSKIQALAKKLRDDQDGNRVLASKTWNGLSTQEKFTYCMIHGENFEQNCDGWPAVNDEEHKIFAWLPSPFPDDMNWSDRQRAFLSNNRAKVIGMLGSLIRSKGDAGSNVKMAIYRLEGFELIPDLVKLYQAKRVDQDILTLLNMLMLDAKYPALMSSQTYTKLYSENADYRASLVANRENQDLVIKRATDFYRSKKK